MVDQLDPLAFRAPEAQTLPVPAPLPVAVSEALRMVRWAHLPEVWDRLAEGRFAEAAAAAGLSGNQGIAQALTGLSAAVEASDGAEGLAALDLEPHCARLEAQGGYFIAAQARRVRSAVVAWRLSEAGASARAGGQMQAWWWCAARLPDQARAALKALLAIEPLHIEALLLSAKFDARPGTLVESRRALRSALRASEGALPPEELAGEALQALLAEAAEQDLSPAAAWVPFAGLLSGEFELTSEPLSRAPTETDRFEQALLRCRAGRARGTLEVDARRELKRIAPLLFARLLEEGLV